MTPCHLDHTQQLKEHRLARVHCIAVLFVMFAPCKQTSSVSQDRNSACSSTNNTPWVNTGITLLRPDSRNSHFQLRVDVTAGRTDEASSWSRRTKQSAVHIVAQTPMTISQSRGSCPHQWQTKFTCQSLCSISWEA
jgi:hypothetical protein